MFSKLGLAALLGAIQVQLAEGATWDYKVNGKDWKDIPGYEACGNSNQSPIDLKTSYADYKNFAKGDDELTKIYSNQYGMSVAFNGHTS